MATDIDRLHSVVSGDIRHRGCGKTFARCHEAAGMIALGHKRIFCRTSTKRDTDYILPMLHDVLKEHGMRLERGTREDEYRVGEAVIRFIPGYRFEKATRGCEGVIVPMEHWA